MKSLLTFIFFLPIVYVTNAQKDTEFPKGWVIYLQAQDKYTVVVTAAGESLVRKPIREFAAALDPEVFWQIHRATIVNSRYIASFKREDEHAEVILRGKKEKLEVSRSYTSRFRQM